MQNAVPTMALDKAKFYCDFAFIESKTKQYLNYIFYRKVYSYQRVITLYAPYESNFF